MQLILVTIFITAYAGNTGTGDKTKNIPSEFRNGLTEAV